MSILSNWYNRSDCGLSVCKARGVMSKSVSVSDSPTPVVVPWSQVCRGVCCTCGVNGQKDGGVAIFKDVLTRTSQIDLGLFFGFTPI